jgi:hypothetical protein
MTMATRKVIKGSAALTLLAMAVVAGGQGNGDDKKEPGKAVPKLTELWVYKDATSKLNITVGEDKKMYQPFDLMPKAMKDNVTFSHEVPAKRLDLNATGTICEFSFKVGAGQWAALRFTPDGEPAGRNPGVNVKGPLILDENKPIYLVVKARTKDKATAVAWFKIGGVKGAHPDGTEEHPWTDVKSLKATLTGEWKEYAIDLKGCHEQLAHVACALTVNVDGDENANNASPVVVYLDDIRFTTERPK